MPKILIISNPEDEHTQTVYRLLKQYECEPLLFYPEEMGMTADLSMRYGNDFRQPEFIFRFNQKEYDLAEFTSVWYRRPRSVALSSHNLTYEGLDFARDEWKTFLRNTYSLMTTSLWVSHPEALERAANKILQLKIANELGFKIPPTLVTNDPEKAQSFASRLEGNLIVKSTGRGWVYQQDGEAVTYVLTNRLSANDWLKIDNLQVSPVTFQKEITKNFEIRANVVGQECLAVKIDSQKSEMSKIDWRRYDVSQTPYTPINLPDEIKKKCLALCQRLGLEFGAIDLIYTPDDEYVFLEVNGNGQFLWAEMLSGVGISGALARLLAGISPALHKLNFNAFKEDN